MALAMWAKSAAGTNFAFLKGFGKALKSWREVLEQAVARRTAPKTRVKRVDLAQTQTDAKDKCLFQPALLPRANSSLQSRIFRSFISRTTSKSLASELRRRSALHLSSSSGRNFRNLPIMSLIGVTLGLDIAAVVDDSAEKMMSEMREMFRGYTWQTEPLEKLPHSLQDLDINLESIANGCEGAVYKAKVKADEAKSSDGSSDPVTDVKCSDGEYDLAVKAVFNYGAESNSQSIVRALEREIVPLRGEGCQDDLALGKRVNRLPPHPNIVDMPGIFVDDMLVTEEGLQKFPAALPRRLNPEQHCGRNKTLYLVMRRRSTHLRDYLASHDISMETRCLMLAQLLEGVSHLSQNGIAHRDLKSDNVLVDVAQPEGTPRLEICDFGCCLAEENKSLKIPFPTRDMSLGGNSWLMAPEIATAVPGPQAVLDFRKSDLWAAGTIAYEILGAENPFYPSKDNSRKQLSSGTYKEEELPPLPAEVPEAVKRLLKALLARNPAKRPSPTVAAAVVQMLVLESTMQGKPLSGERKVRAVVKQTHGLNGKRLPVRKSYSVPVFYSREREKLSWILEQSFSLMCQLTFSSQSQGWDMRSVMNFLLLSRLSYADFKEAMKFF